MTKPWPRLTPMRYAIFEAMSNVALGEQSTCNIYNRLTGEAIIRKGKKMCKTHLLRLAESAEWMEVAPTYRGSSFIVKIQAIRDGVFKKFNAQEL